MEGDSEPPDTQRRTILKTLGAGSAPYRVSVVQSLVVVMLVALSMAVSESQVLKVGFLLVAMLLWFVPIMLDPRLAMVVARTGQQESNDSEFESRFYRASWYSYNLLLAMGFGYFMVNATTEVSVPLWVLGFAVVGSTAFYWVMMWWID